MNARNLDYINSAYLYFLLKHTLFSQLVIIFIFIRAIVSSNNQNEM